MQFIIILQHLKIFPIFFNVSCYHSMTQFQVELGVVIGSNGSNIVEEEAMNYVGGYVLGE